MLPNKVDTIDNKYLQNNLYEAREVNAKIVDENNNRTMTHADEKITLTSVNQSDPPVEVLLDDFLFVQSDGNYLEVYFLDDEKPQKHLLRNTLVHAESILQEYFPPLIRCHRSFIVNLDQIKKVDGNAQGLVLKMKAGEEKVPVSRKYIEEIKSKLS